MAGKLFRNKIDQIVYFQLLCSCFVDSKFGETFRKSLGFQCENGSGSDWFVVKVCLFWRCFERGERVVML